jgi:putative SOS response-associated peptidase YedK
MCGRIVQSSDPIRLQIIEGIDIPDSRVREVRPRFNGVPEQELLVIRQNPKTGARSLDLLRWGLIPHGTTDPDPKVRPINATAERVAAAPMFREAYAKRRCIVPVDGFFEWRAIKGQRAKQPYAVAMKDGGPFGLAGIWENWQHPETDEWIRTFAIITTNANELLAPIHERMPVILAPADYKRWLSTIEPDPRDLLKPYPAEPMRIWPISTRVNRPKNDDAAILEPISEPPQAAEA